jgi:protein phosphatase
VRIVILSDIHGNIEALKAITEPWGELWVLGDLVNYGPNPAEAVDFIRERATIVVRGNHDHAIGAGVDPQCSEPFLEMAQAMQVYTDSVLNQEQKTFLRELPLTACRNVDGREYFLCHAAPSDPLFRYLPADSPQWAAEAAAIDAQVLLVGHTHVPFILDLPARQVVNPGSVDQPKHGAAESCFAILDSGQVSLRSSIYAVEETTRKVHAPPVDEQVRIRLSHVLRRGGL